MSARPRVFSGVQPTGSLHLGNYLGALKQWVRHQDERENVFCIVDLHALTIPEARKPGQLRHDGRALAAMFVASGIDPVRSIVFVQSQVREHAELAWILSCVTPIGWLERMTQFKSKSEGRETVGTGLMTYPVLQAADIVLYDTRWVPVGEDQRQHIELARDIAVRFNHLFGETFVLPEATLPAAGARVMGFDEPTVKMSKSLAAARPNHAVMIDEDPARIKKTIMRAVTDGGCEYAPQRASAGVLNLMGVLSAITGEAVLAIAGRYEGRGYGYLKGEVADAVISELAPVRLRFQQLMSDPAELDRVVQGGAERAREIAAPVIGRARAAVGVG